MSNQAERIKAFKLAQHARLQKQDEEEQWISSEELCTEGSSDEETSNTKQSHRKPKRNIRTEKRGISPLAQPPKNIENEDTSTYQSESNYLLPEATSVRKPVEKRPESLNLRTTTADVNVGFINSKVGDLDLASSSKKESSECSDDDDIDLEQMIQWRPKRGSIKLPEFPEGMIVEVATVSSTTIN